MTSGCLNLEETNNSFSKLVMPVCIPTNSAREVHLLHILISTWNCLFFNLVALMDVEYSLSLSFFSHFYTIFLPWGKCTENPI